MALAGLRRMVVHSRDQLAVNAARPAWKYTSDAWSPGQINTHAAMLLAQHVLTLVADCLPDDGGLSADEAAGVRAECHASLAAMQTKLAAYKAQSKVDTDRAKELESQIEQAVLYRDAAEEDADNWRVQWRTAQEMAHTNIAAAIRYLEDPSGEDSPTEVVAPSTGEEGKA